MRLNPSMMRSRCLALALVLTLLLQVGVAGIAVAQGSQPANGRHFYQQQNLVSDLAGQAAVQDTNLVNPWGIVAGPQTPFWVSDNGTGVSTLYANGKPFSPFGGPPLVVIIPPPKGSPPNTTAAPTGVVFNATTDFQVSEGQKTGAARFIFATEDGTISGWSPAVDLTHAILKVDNSPQAVYKGLAIAQTAQGSFIYATNFRAGQVEVYNSNFGRVHLSGSFTDSRIPGGYAPFGIRNVGGMILVTYAKQDAAKHDDVAGQGHGFVDAYSTSGQLLQRLISHGQLNSPWGLALAPHNFGRFSNDLLVGNFGDGRISAYDPNTGNFRGKLRDQNAKPITIQGLWGLAFGNDALAGPSNVLFFTAGINGEKDGLFGSLTAH